MTAIMPRTALFVIDIQKELADDPQTEIPHAARIRDAGDRILDAARNLASSVPQGKQPALIVFVQHEERPEQGTLANGSEPWKLVFNPREGAKDEILVAKITRDTFESNPHLAEKLKEQGIDGIVAFGIQSECCVQETCKGALAAGFGVTILRGAHSTYDTKGKSAVDIERSVEEMLQTRGAKVVPWEDAVARWQGAGVVF
ncbi:hypothetical protein JDV02_009722 [Purpureocillium takamizusanense]|uniref:Isochorismatase-like domain-containing protein n=1 Tax=Purpureocillium takamizusanense TaxID=2060973 RepID=A0A9Q8QQK4_9HYPO|nr:uncharacterized protein JDV02_009722 [Purpureocillium takamizusanense]UNI23933.1 hypothetical protein JDV02_009722 [Purpureocillium takamizusanense]